MLAGLPAAFDAQMMHEQAVLAAPHHAALYAAHGLDVEGLARAAGPTPLAASLVRRFLACCA
ncbi:class-I glutamine amidotransferase) [Bordetella pertussis]|nr:class-I glutamine amidotransferase) [Bordetella pertussis]